MQRWILLALSLAVATSVALPKRASACWDGYYGQTDHLVIMGGDTEWSLARAERMAIWLPRIEALLAARDVRVEAAFGEAYLSNGRVLGYPEGKPHRLFAALARGLSATPAERRAAMRARADARTIQVAASRDRDAALALAARLNAAGLGEHGFYEAGGFPSDNDRAHVVEAEDGEGRTVYRVLVGAFLDRAEASRVAATLRPITGAAFLRPL